MLDACFTPQYQYTVHVLFVTLPNKIIIFVLNVKVLSQARLGKTGQHKQISSHK